MIPTKVVFRGFEPSEAIRSEVKRLVERLFHYNNKILRAEVILSFLHRHKNNGNIFHVSILLHLPNRQIVINRNPELDHSHEFFSVALRDAFRSARRKLEDQIRIDRRQVKSHRTKISIPKESLQEVP